MNFKGFKIPKEAKRNGKTSVEWYLTTKYNQVAKGSGSAHAPKIIMSSRWLRDRYEANLMCLQRFVFMEKEPDPDPPLVSGKCARYYAVDWLKGWDVKFL